MSDCTRKLVLLFIKTCTKITFWKDSISQTKLNYYSGIICSNEGNSKLLFSLLNNILRPPASLPPHLYSTAFCNSMMSFFNQKIHQIHLYLGPSSSVSTSPEPCLTSHSFSFLQLPSDSDISDLILKSKPSTCQLDPLPTVLVKAFLPSLLPLISAIIHSSLQY